MHGLGVRVEELGFGVEPAARHARPAGERSGRQIAPQKGYHLSQNGSAGGGWVVS